MRTRKARSAARAVAPRARRGWVVAMTVLALVAVSCGGDTEVGEGVEIVDGEGQGGGAIRDTTTTAPPTSTPETTEASVDTAPRTTAPPTTQAPVNEILVQDDTQGAQFEPRILQVPRGQVVRWRNVGTRTYSVVFDDGSFTTGDIPPGGSADWRADRVGTFDYHDGHRPYAVGRVQVFE